MQITQDKPKAPSGSRADQLISRYKMLKGLRSNFESYWQTLHNYFYIEAQDVNTAYSPGSELNVDKLYDSTTLECADVLASGFMNYLTPPTSKWFALKSKDYQYADNKPVNKFLEDIADEVNYTLNRSNFYNQIIASYKSSGVYGTSVLLAEEDVQDDARFYSIPIKNVCIADDGAGRVGEYYIEFEYTAYQAADKFGAANLSKEMQQELLPENRTEKKHCFLLYIGKRFVRDISRQDSKNLPIEATWIDVEGKRVVNESGYHEFPVMCHRFDKRPFIPWGFSPAMKSLPFARILNAIAKTNLRSMMKHTDPPLAMPNNAFIMPFNSNPRAVNYYNKKAMDSKDIFSFSNNGNPDIGMNALEYYTMRVKALMFNDAFLAFDSITKQMNNPEVMERINEKMSMLGPAVGRYISEMLNPVIIRTIGILWRKGKLPQPPEEFMANPSYEIDCISQLAQAQRRSELNSLVSGLSIVGQIAQFVPDALDKIDSDAAVDEAWGIIGAPARVLRDEQQLQRLREVKAQIAEQQAQMQMAQAGADVVKAGSEVDVNLAKADAENDPNRFRRG